MDEARQQLRDALWLLAQGATEDNDIAVKLIRDRVELDENSIRWELHALRVFAVESGLYLGCGKDSARYDEMMAALYAPMIRQYREDPDQNAALDFNVLKARVELYRGCADRAGKDPQIEPKNLVQHIGRQFAALCHTRDRRVAAVGSGVFVETSKMAKRVSEAPH
ncbi:MAG: hypothetical protein JSW71_01590 [Gemmatimonadota bacterium]|nr:MAG: hypothetical protein JSW71_01590 [Gemmatimonadota bacterium]